MNASQKPTTPKPQDPTTICPVGGYHRPDPANPRRCVDCNAWPLK